MDDQASSVDNSFDRAAIVYEKRNGRGDSICIEPNTPPTNLSTLSFDNVASSTKITKKDACPL
jgi:hypothetical protein